MKKFQVVGALAAMFSFSALMATGASATLWLKENKSLGGPTNAQMHGSFIMVHTVLGVASKDDCTYLLDGTVGPNNEDQVTKVLGLKGEEGLITCELISGGVPGCTAPHLILIHALNLPWKTELLLVEEGGKLLTWEDFLSSGVGPPGWDVLCESSLLFDCVSNTWRLHFDENLADGALFLWLGKSSGEESCSDGGTEIAEETTTSNVMLGFTVS